MGIPEHLRIPLRLLTFPGTKPQRTQICEGYYRENMTFGVRSSVLLADSVTSEKLLDLAEANFHY